MQYSQYQLTAVATNGALADFTDTLVEPYSHDAAGCVTRIARAGQPALDLSWDAQYRLASVSTNGVVVEACTYDPFGRRAYTATGPAMGSITNWHAYVGMHCVTDVAGNGTILRSYTYGPGIDNLLALTDHTTATPTVLFAITDHLGTVHALADETGTIVECYSYDAWGNVLDVWDDAGLPTPDSRIGNRFLFQGREHSFATGLTNFRARWYDPETGRWLSNDPIGISGGLNQYVFCGNDPVKYRDPMGLTAVEEVTKGAYIYVKYPGDKMHGPHVHVLARRGRTLLGRVTPDGSRILTGKVPNSALKKLAGGAIFSAVMIAFESTALADARVPGRSPEWYGWESRYWSLAAHAGDFLPFWWSAERRAAERATRQRAVQEWKALEPPMYPSDDPYKDDSVADK